jgi:hypothetical protein
VSRPQVAPALLLLATLALASCGGAARPRPVASANPSSGVYGIAVTMPWGALPAPAPPPSPLPGGFGLSGMVPAGDSTICVKAFSGAHAGDVVARVKADSLGIFRVTLPPGSYVVYGRPYPGGGKTVVVKAGSYARVIVVAFLHF